MTTLSNGLTIISERNAFRRKAAVLAVRYGSDDMNFADYRTPAGIAHFLEHKMFDMPDGRNVHRLYSELGASPNAYTSHALTAYHFDCTDRFEDCLKLLLEYVYTPYFERESVERERDVIAQELAMYHDNPQARLMDELLAATYAAHPARIPVGGTRDSIQGIDAKLLSECYAAFYTPSNMVLGLSGDIDEQRVAELAERLSPPERRPALRCSYGSEPRLIEVREKTVHMDVDVPIMGMAVKLAPAGDALERDIALCVMLDCLIGAASPLYSDLYGRGLIDAGFSEGPFVVDSACSLIFRGRSREPQAVRDAILREAERLTRQGVDDSLFERAKKSALGGRARLADNPLGTANAAASYFLMGSDHSRWAQVVQNLKKPDFSVITDKNTALVTIRKG